MKDALNKNARFAKSVQYYNIIGRKVINSKILCYLYFKNPGFVVMDYLSKEGAENTAFEEILSDRIVKVEPHANLIQMLK